MAELEGQLARSAASWKLVIGHHPVLSSGHHGDTPELLDTLDPVLRKYGVQVCETMLHPPLINPPHQALFRAS